jgi:hypothetical protein
MTELLLPLRGHIGTKSGGDRLSPVLYVGRLRLPGSRQVLQETVTLHAPYLPWDHSALAEGSTPSAILVPLARWHDSGAESPRSIQR